MCPQNGLDVGKDLFLGSSPEFRRKNGLILDEDLSFLVCIILKFPAFLSKIRRTLVSVARGRTGGLAPSPHWSVDQNAE